MSEAEKPLEAVFVKSSSTLQQCPVADRPEYAFTGRSNVGKSSLINMLLGRKNLAKTSGKPGKTQLINHYSIAESGSRSRPWYLVDLPGYGYARVSKQLREGFKGIIQPYIMQRSNLLCTFVLVDIRHEPQGSDMGFMEWLGLKEIPFAILFTKSDKLRPKAISRQVEAYAEVMLETWEVMPSHFITSAATGAGRREVLQFIGDTNSYYQPHS